MGIIITLIALVAIIWTIEYVDKHGVPDILMWIFVILFVAAFGGFITY
jgi:hypothetical protein